MGSGRHGGSENMNMALIFAGGTGIRMNSRAKPKQFLEMYGKPIIIHTLEHFDKHPEIDGIVVVCLENWLAGMEGLLEKFEIRKVLRVVPGGGGGHESIYFGLEAMRDLCGPDSIVLIHDGVRPLITRDLISDNIAAVKTHGTAISVEPARETVASSRDGQSIDGVPNRDHMYMAKAPQSFRYGMIRDLYRKARAAGTPTVDSAHLLSLYGVDMHMVPSPPNNIKITAPTDFYILRALYEVIENEQVFGL
jgi:2-C-methyl-D-erythritol 4-phosphate cytidylyltransferase